MEHQLIPSPERHQGSGGERASITWMTCLPEEPGRCCCPASCPAARRGPRCPARRCSTHHRSPRPGGSSHKGVPVVGVSDGPDPRFPPEARQRWLCPLWHPPSTARPPRRLPVPLAEPALALPAPGSHCAWKAACSSCSLHFGGWARGPRACQRAKQRRQPGAASSERHNRVHR